MRTYLKIVQEHSPPQGLRSATQGNLLSMVELVTLAYSYRKSSWKLQCNFKAQLSPHKAEDQKALRLSCEFIKAKVKRFVLCLYNSSLLFPWNWNERCVKEEGSSCCACQAPCMRIPLDGWDGGVGRSIREDFPHRVPTLLIRRCHILSYILQQSYYYYYGARIS